MSHRKKRSRLSSEPTERAPKKPKSTPKIYQLFILCTEDDNHTLCFYRDADAESVSTIFKMREQALHYDKINNPRLSCSQESAFTLALAHFLLGYETVSYEPLDTDIARLNKRIADDYFAKLQQSIPKSELVHWKQEHFAGWEQPDNVTFKIVVWDDYD